jgi:hypothetical protein
MTPRPLPSDFLLRHGRLGWRHVVWGVERGWADPRLFVDLATDRLLHQEQPAPAAVTLAGVDPDEMWEAPGLAAALAAGEAPVDEPELVARWLYLVLRWVYENRDTVPDPLGVVEELYADFGYPPGMEPFVRFMPPTDGWDSGAHTLAENEARMMANWEGWIRAREREQEVLELRGGS